MNKTNHKAFGSHISKLVEGNEISAALDLLSKAAMKVMDESLGQEIVLLNNKWERLKTEKTNKTIRAEEAEVRYNQVCINILSVSNDLAETAAEKGIALISPNNSYNQSLSKAKTSKRTLISGTGIASILVLIIALIYYINQPEEMACPFPEESENYHILLIPFEEMGLHDPKSKTSEGITVAVQNRFQAMQMNKQLPLDVRVDRKSKIEVQALDPNHAWEYAANCHSDLLLSGLFEQTQGVDLDSLIITFKYLAVDRKKSDSIFTTGIERHAVASLSSLIHGSFPGKIEDIIYWALGIKAFEEENYAGAIQHFDAILPESEQSQIKVDLAKAEAIQRLGNYTEAFHKYKQLEAQSNQLDIQQKVVVFNNLAALALELDQPKVAIESMERAIKLAPDHQVLRQNSQLIREIQMNQPISQVDISDNTTSIQLMTSTRTISEKADANFISETLKRIDTTNASPTSDSKPTSTQNLSLGIRARQAKNYQSAIAYLDKVLEETPTQYVGLLERGYSHVQLGHYEDALEDYNQALKLQPSSPDAFLRRGQLFRQMARYQAAIADFEKLKTLGKTKEALTQIAFVYADMKSYQQAINVIEQILVGTPKDQDLLDFKRRLMRKAAQQENH